MRLDSTAESLGAHIALLVFYKFLHWRAFLITAPIVACWFSLPSIADRNNSVINTNRTSVSSEKSFAFYPNQLGFSQPSFSRQPLFALAFWSYLPLPISQPLSFSLPLSCAPIRSNGSEVCRSEVNVRTDPLEEARKRKGNKVTERKRKREERRKAHLFLQLRTSSQAWSRGRRSLSLRRRHQENNMARKREREWEYVVLNAINWKSFLIYLLSIEMSKRKRINAWPQTWWVMLRWCSREAISNWACSCDTACFRSDKSSSQLQRWASVNKRCGNQRIWKGRTVNGRLGNVSLSKR